jgi:hypothetical protein
MTDRSFVEQNAAATARLETLIDRLTDNDLARPVGHGWTMSAALAHLGFWEQRALVLLEKWTREGAVTPSPADADVINDASLPHWLALPPRTATAQLLDAVHAVNEALANAGDAMIDAIQATPDTIIVHRWRHRTEHLDEIERVLAG